MTRPSDGGPADGGPPAATPHPGRTALFVCRCGPHIGEHLDLEELARWAGARPGVEFVESHELLCAPAGREAFVAALRARDVSAVVIAGCSPKMHEKTFRDLAEEAGLNLAQVQMANIREHCAWVTPDRVEATAKAKALVESALQRAALAAPLHRRTMPARTDLLVIGGGIAGIEAALTAARAGRKVFLVEREISLGGWLVGVEEVAPAMECGPCLLAPRLALVKDEPNIEVITNAEVRQVLGFMGNFRATIVKRARFVDDSCIGCEACYEVCPVETPNPFHLGLGPRKAINALFAGSVPAAAAIDRESCARLTGRDPSCDACAQSCPFESVNFAQRDEELEIEVGAVILATGFGRVDLGALPTLGYGAHPEVYTLPELERLIASNGPYGGELRRRDGRAPSSIAVIHCAGSRRDDGLSYCSGVCCATAIKAALFLRRTRPDVTVYNVYEQLTLPGPKAQRLHRQALEAGGSFVRCAATDSVAVRPAGEQLRVTAAGMEPLEVDMAVLATGLPPSTHARTLAAMLHVELDGDGFFRADHDVLHATGAAIDGIYLAGCAAGPCDAATAVTRARAAVGDALARLVPGREIELEILTATIDEDRCAGCKLCIAVCPYKAIAFDAAAGVSRVTEAICHGCGTCSAACPSGACTARHYTDEQILAEIGGLIDV